MIVMDRCITIIKIDEIKEESFRGGDHLIDGEGFEGRKRKRKRKKKLNFYDLLLTFIPGQGCQAFPCPQHC